MAFSAKLKTWIVLYMSAFSIHVALSACPTGWFSSSTGNNATALCYKVFSTVPLSFNDSNNYCKTNGGSLAKEDSLDIHNALKSTVVSELLTNGNKLWIGLKDVGANNGAWVWIDGKPLGTYTSWANRNINGSPFLNDCVYVSLNNGNSADYKWRTTANCAQTIGFICQKNQTAPVLTTTTLRPLNCSPGWTSFPAQRTCIRLYSSPTTWPDARQQCRRTMPMADLVKLSNSALTSFVNTLITANKGIYWIGLNDQKKEGWFSWLDETNKTTYVNWDAGRSNNSGGNENCVVADGNKNNKWSDLDCNTLNRFICQIVPFNGFPVFSPRPTFSQANCGPGGWEDVVNSDTCLQFNDNVLSWLDANASCNAANGYLATVSSVEEQAYISARALSFSSDMFWIGANDRNTESGFQWTDGAPFAYFNWADKQPDNSLESDCTVMSQKGGKWNDVPCDSRHGYICKKKGRVTFTSLITTTTAPPHLPVDQIFGCPRGWDNYRGSCYKLIQSDVGVDWPTASAACSSSDMQAVLVTIIDADENKFVFSMLPKVNTGYVWIGLQDPQENTFTWVDDTPVQYTNWQPGEPNNNNNEDCVEMFGSNGKWNDGKCNNAYNMYICKKSKSILPRTGSDEEQGCTNGSIGYGAQCYSFVPAKKNFGDAQKDCRATSKNLGNLATVDSGHLQAFLSAELYAQPSLTYWIGLQQSNDVYKWQSKWPVDFTYWGKNHTGSERWTCVALQRTGLWANYPCSTTNMSYICEAPRPGYTTPTIKTIITKPQPCPTGWLAYGSLCYMVFSVNMTDMLSWGDARDFCARQADGGSLLTINDNATQSFLMTKLISSGNFTGRYWIGLTDQDSESRYVWLDQSLYLFANWAPNEPNDQQNKEDCVEWVLPDNNWNDDYCYVSKNWICQVPAGSKITTPMPVETGVQSAACGNASWTQSSKGYCYFVSAPDGDLASATWFDARQICISMGADLASISGEDENGLITSLVSKNPVDTFWIGLNDLDMDTYGWTDLSPVGYVSWALNEPNDDYGGERCVEMNSKGSWSDIQCQSTQGYVCKKLAGGVSVTPYIPVPPTGGCPKDFVSIPSLGYCYAIGGTTNGSQKNFDDAIKACDLMVHKSQLASIHTSLEAKYILTLISSLRIPAWIGLNDRKNRNQFEWVDNTAVTFTNWGPGQPDENLNNNNPDARRDCVDIEIRRNIGTWNDNRCANQLAYVCKSLKGSTFPTVAPDSTGCHAGYQRFRSSCYKFFTDYYNWNDAQTTCKADGGNLATISSGVEQAFVEILTGHTNDSFQFWLGLKYDQVSAAFSWADGWPVRFSNWGHGEPNIGGGQSCVIHMVDEQWHVVNCTERHRFVCEVNLGSPSPTRTFTGFGRCLGRNWNTYAGNCYSVQTSSPKSWAAANAACLSMGANLASIHSDAEAHTLTNFIGHSDLDTWIGLSKGQGNGFSWYDGTEMEYVYWAAGEPSDPESNLHQDCVKMRSQDGGWADTDCFDQNNYICKKAQVYWTRGSNNSDVIPTLPGKSSFGSSDSSSDLSGGAIAGVVLGIIILIAIIVVTSFLVVRYHQNQSIPNFGAQKLPPSEPGFDNASYSTNTGVKVSASDA